MPFYEFDLAVPAATAFTSPATLVARVKPGHVTHVDVHFPPGCAGLVFSAARRFASQIYPSNPRGNIKGDGLVVSWDDDYPVDQDPLFFTLVGWSPSARFAHTVTWRFEVLPLDQARAQAETPGLIASIGRAILGRNR